MSDDTPRPIPGDGDARGLAQEKKKSKSKRLVWYDELGNFLGEKLVKVDDLGNPIKKKKSSQLRINGENEVEHGDSVSSIGLGSTGKRFQLGPHQEPPSGYTQELPKSINQASNDYTNTNTNSTFHHTTDSLQLQLQMQMQMQQETQAKSEMHELVVLYLISAGADPTVAEETANRFENQQQRGMDAFTTAPARPNTPNRKTFRTKHSADMDKFAIFGDEDDEASVASAILRVLKQGTARAPQHDTDQKQLSPTMAQMNFPPAARCARSTSPPIRDDDSGMRASLIQHLLSAGLETQLAEQMADQFKEQTRNLDLKKSPPLGNQTTTLSQQHHAALLQSWQEKQQETRKNGKVVQQAQQQTNTPTTHLSSRQPRPHTHWPRSQRPGAFEMEGRAFGAPLREEVIPDLERNRITPPDVESASDHNYIEAVPVTEKENDIVYAETATFGIKSILNESPIRRLLIVMCLVLVAITVGVSVFASQRQNDNARTQIEFVTTSTPSISPTLAPSLIIDEIEKAAILISGAATVAIQNSPQRRAVVWMSTKDDFDTQDQQLFAERYILTVLYFATYGENWLEQENWLSPTRHVCDWSDGIICGTDLVRKRVVIGIELTRNGLSGQIVSEVGLIEGLKVLRLDKNYINGTIPEQISELSNLATLDLSTNQLSGPIPHRIGDLQDLITLDLSDNRLTSTIPQSTYDLQLLNILDFSSNTLTGQLSTNVTKLLSIGTLNVRGNQLNGHIPSFQGLNSLDFIWLDNNQFSGALPDLGTEMISRQEFTLSHNRITGRLPENSITNYTAFLNTEFKIQRADVSYNLLTGTIPQLIAYTPSFRYIDFSGNAFTGKIPAVTNGLGWPVLKFFRSANNQHTGTIPLGFSTSLTSLDVSTNHLTGEIPFGSFTMFPELEFLAFNNNPLGGSISYQIANLTSINNLELSNCSLTGVIPDNLNRLTSLEVLDLQGNEIRGPIPTSIGSLLLLRELELQNNIMTGPLPSELGMLELLTTLNVAGNQLTGSLPSSLAMLSKLKEFSVSRNFFTGEVPLEVCGNLNVTFEMVGCDLVCSCCSQNTLDNATTLC